MEKAVRLVLMLSLTGMAISSAYLLYTTGRYIVLQAYEPRFIQVPVQIEKSPSVEQMATSSHATTTLQRSSDPL